MENTAATWDQRYQQTNHSLSRPREFLLEYESLLPSSGWALDIAMGLGHNAAILKKHGMQVVGVDFSWVALTQARKSYPFVLSILANLPDFRVANACFDVILNFWFLDRSLYPLMKAALKPGGLLFLETMREDERLPSQNVNPAYLLTSGELETVFGDWHILVHDEIVRVTSHGTSQPAERLLVRKPDR